MRDLLVIDSAEDLDTEATLAIVGGRRLELGRGMLLALSERRSEVMHRLNNGEPVYGVNTGMGAASTIRLDDQAQSLQQSNLMLARAVGSAPWLGTEEVRAVLVVRLRTFLTGDAGVSEELCTRLVDLLNLDLQPAIPRSRLGAAGEIIPLAHLGGALTGSGEYVSAAGTRSAMEVLADVGLSPFSLGPKEGVALIEGIPVTTGLAMLCARDARAIAEQATAVVSAELSLISASRDPFTSAIARADPELAIVLGAVRELAGESVKPRTLQSPLSFRVVGPAIAQLIRSISAVDRAVSRAIVGVTDSPAFLDGRFVGTAGFDGFELAASLDALRLSTIHLAETSTARLHRLLDDRVTGLPRQLSDEQGLHAGLVAVHKRAVGVIHEMLARGRPSSLGAIETSLGQEDVQSFSIEAATACGDAIAGARDVLACELLAVIQGMRLSPQQPSSLGFRLDVLLADISAQLPDGTADRPFGREIAAISQLLASGWARGIFQERRSSLEE
jgi:histidine ammonia-lyase